MSWRTFSAMDPIWKLKLAGTAAILKMVDVSFYKLFQKVTAIVLDKVLTWNLVNRVTVHIPIAVLNTIYENITIFSRIASTNIYIAAINGECVYNVNAW